jgi:hypothetical protein
MGTPVACTYAMLSFGHHENVEILPTFQPNLIYYRCYIDDILGIWVPPSNVDNDSFERFKAKLNSWGSLKWVVQNPTKRIQFLDLDLSLDNSRITMETYQKPMNLYLYIPPLSAHPPSCFKGLIFGEIRRYWLQNTPEKFQELLSKFVQRLVNRGHNLHTLTQILTKAASTLDSRLQNHDTPKKDDNNTLYIHWRYHPNGLQCSDIRQIFDKTLHSHLPYDSMHIAISRPKNLRDMLSKSALVLPKNINTHDLINTISPAENQHIQPEHLCVDNAVTLGSPSTLHTLL